MSTITWKPSVGGAWTNTLDWIDGVVPGIADTAVVSSPAETSADVFIGSGTSIAVGAVVLQANAEVLDSGTLTVAGTMALAGGALVLSGGTIAGTIDFAGGRLATETSGTLDGVVLAGSSNNIVGSLDVIGGLAVQSATVDFSNATLDFSGAQTLQANALLGLDASISGTLTLAAGTTIDDTGATLTIAGGTLVNDGVMLAAALAGGSALVNNGQITLDGTGEGPGYAGDDLDNTGTILIAGGATYDPILDHSTDYFINDGLIVVGAGGVLAPETGSLTVTPMTTGTGTISLDAGGLLAVAVELSGGTILGSGGTIEPAEFGLTDTTIAGIVTILGGLDSSNLSLSGSASATLDPELGESFGDLTDTGTLTMDIGAALAFGGGTGAFLAVTAASLDLGGTVGALPGGTLTIQAATFNTLDQPTFGTLSNSGMIATGAGETLILSAANIVNSGTILLVAGATLEFTPFTKLAALDAIQNSGGIIAVAGTLDATGATATLTPGSVLSQVTFLPDAVLQGGTFLAGGGSLPAAGTISDTTWRGGLDLSGVPQITIENGLTVEDAAGGPGLLSLAGGNTQAILLSDTTLDNMTIALGASLANPGSADFSGLVAPFANLTIGPNASVMVGGDLPEAGIYSSETVTNAGTIEAVGTGSIADGGGTTGGSFQAGVFVNNGVIDVDPDNASFSNPSGDIVSNSNKPPEAELSRYDSSLEDGLPWSLFIPPEGSGLSVPGNPYAANRGSEPPTTSEIATVLAQENTVAGTGTITALAGAFVEFDSSIASSQTLAFAGTGAVMTFADARNVAGHFVNFATGDAIDLELAGYVGGSATLSAGQIVVPTASGDIALNVGLAPGITLTQLLVEEDPAGGTALVVACFAEGTRISTPRGPVAVERLREGGTVVTASGEAQPVIWIGHRRVAPRRHPRPLDMQPVRIRAGGFADGVPERDVRLSPDHAVLIDGWLIPVRLLVNGVSVVREDVASVTYWHVELPRHDVLLAEGLPCESFLDAGTRGAFVGGGAALDLHPTFGQRVWDGAACAPLALSGPAVAKARARLAGRLAHNLDQSLGFGYDSLCRRS